MTSPLSYLKEKNKILNIFLIILIVITSVCVFVLTLISDNKYTITNKNNQVFYQDNKLTLLSEDSLNNITPIIYWNFYDGLIDPSAMSDIALEHHLIKIGEFSNFDTNDTSKSTGTYRATIYSYTEDEYISISLYLPEVLSAYKIFANGVLIKEVGVISNEENNYTPYIQNQNLTITFKHSVDIVLQVANFTHYYGGVYYPPLVASVGTMQSYTTINTVTYSLIFSISLLVAISSFFVYFFKKDKAYLWSGLLSLAFALYIFYPIYHMIGSHVITLMYGLENVGTLLISVFMLLVCTNLMKKNVQVEALNTILIIFSILTIVLLTLFGFYTPLNNFAQIFSAIVRLGIGLYLICISVINVIKEDKMFTVFIASLIYALGLIFDVFVASYYDPYYFLYPNELGTFISVILFLFLTISYNAKTSSENNKWNATLVNEVANRTEKMRNLISERRDFVSSLAHDLKSPLASLSLLVQKLQENNFTKKEEEKIYETMDDKIKSLTQNLTLMQTFNNLDLIDSGLEQVDIYSFMKDIYEEFKPEAEAEGIHLKHHINFGVKAFALIPTKKFERAIENILFNALSFTEENGNIVISVTSNSKNVFIKITDDGQGMTPEIQQHIFEKFFTYREKENYNNFNSDGLGLYYTKLVIDECDGEITCDSTYAVGTTFTITLPKLDEKHEITKK